MGVSFTALLWPEDDDQAEAASVRVAPVVSDRGGALHVNVMF